MLRTSGNKREILATFSSLEKQKMYDFIRNKQQQLRENNEPGHVYQAHRRSYQ
tara:strand:+ start:512 stop:670 length:159 start_codon:yes stop_codon:yes gene_type:complete